mmetsp:Transcript_29505/g.73580  ORF Transcript_29505/g.73580 Transcript_29505/m.73580 type:complete len:233 (+) Transcript_29505:2036-2734(+)
MALKGLLAIDAVEGRTKRMRWGCWGVASWGPKRRPRLMRNLKPWPSWGSAISSAISFATSSTNSSANTSASRALSSSSSCSRRASSVAISSGVIASEACRACCVTPSSWVCDSSPSIIPLQSTAFSCDVSASSCLMNSASIASIAAPSASTFDSLSSRNSSPAFSRCSTPPCVSMRASGSGSEEFSRASPQEQVVWRKLWAPNSHSFCKTARPAQVASRHRSISAAQGSSTA